MFYFSGEIVIPERQWEEITIDVPWGHVAGKWYGERDKQPVLAFHGWQDNAGTFDRLVPLLPKTIPIFCIDLPGHGKSSHFPVGMQYHIFWDYIPVVRRIVKKFGWKKVKLMGHSLGGAVCFMYAASFPDDVAQFISIDLYGPSIRDLKKNARMTGHCIDKALEYEVLPTTKLPCYTYDEMVSLAMDAYNGSIDHEAAKILMIRGMNEAPKNHSKDGYFFSRDLRLKVSILALFSLEQVIAYAECIKCHVLNIKAIPGMKHEREDVYSMVVDAIRKNGTVEYHEVSGTHHLHLMTPESIAPIISSFLLSPEEDIETDIM